MASDLNKWVDKIYVLTIDRNADRHPHVRSILNNIDFEFWNGLDAKESFPGKKYVTDLDELFFVENDIDKHHVSRLNMGQFGAYLSIKKMIDHAAASNYDKVLFFEDDLIPLRKDWQNILQKSISELPEDWDILLAGYIFDGTVYKYSYNRNFRFLVRYYNRIKSLFKKGRNLPQPRKYSAHLDLSGFSMGGHAFCLSAKGARLLSTHLSPMRDSGDVLISELIIQQKIKAYSVYPCLFLQDATFGSKTNVA